MVKSSTGTALVITIGGGSHQSEMTLKMEGVPSGYTIRGKNINKLLARRAPGKSPLSTSRKETDLAYLKQTDDWIPINDETQFITPENGILEFFIKNENHNSAEYQLKLPRPGHADLPAFLKYKGSVNMAGGGPFSGRMTAMTTLAGAVAMEILSSYGIKIGSSILSIGNIQGLPIDLVDPINTAHGLTPEMEAEILDAKTNNDSVGGVVEGFATDLPTGMGGPMFDGLESILSHILFSIPAVKGVEFGAGFDSATMNGSKNNDDILKFDNKKIFTETNNAGGILGGISTGMPLITRVAFKPAPSIGKLQKTVNVQTGEPQVLKIKGRHDPCIIPRGRVVVEAAMAIGILEAMVQAKMIDQLPTKSTACQESSTPLDINSLRQAIDKIDDQISQLLDQRMEISKAVAKFKVQNQISVKDSRREEQILNKVGDDYQDIYREIFKVSRKLQHEITDKNI